MSPQKTIEVVKRIEQSGAAVRQPLAHASHVPYRLYSDPEVLELEKEVALAEIEVPEDGCDGVLGHAAHENRQRRGGGQLTPERRSSSMRRSRFFFKRPREAARRAGCRLRRASASWTHPRWTAR